MFYLRVSFWLQHIFPSLLLPHLCIGVHHWGLYFKVWRIHPIGSWHTSFVCAAEWNHWHFVKDFSKCQQTLFWESVIARCKVSSFTLQLYLPFYTMVIFFTEISLELPRFFIELGWKPKRQTHVWLQYFQRLHLNTQIMAGEAAGWDQKSVISNLVIL